MSRNLSMSAFLELSLVAPVPVVGRSLRRDDTDWVQPGRSGEAWNHRGESPTQSTRFSALSAIGVSCTCLRLFAW